jgi:DNA-binding GntR family transcriptional regulator
MAAHPIRSVIVPKHPSQYFIETDVRLAMRKEVAALLADDQAIEQEVNKRLAEYELFVAREERANARGYFNANS